MVTAEHAQQQLNIKKVAYGPISWLDVEMPTLAEMEYLRRTFDFHTLALDDCLSRVQLPKMDDYDDYLFLVLHSPLQPGGASHRAQPGQYLCKRRLSRWCRQIHNLMVR